MFCIGCLGGSIIGGRYSDYIFSKLKARNGGVSAAEVYSPLLLITSDQLPDPWPRAHTDAPAEHHYLHAPPCGSHYWLWLGMRASHQRGGHLRAALPRRVFHDVSNQRGFPCSMHTKIKSDGIFGSAIYASTLAYIVDANTGRSSSAVASNSCFRGTTAFIAAEVAVPLQVCTTIRAVNTSCVDSSHALIAQNAIGDGGLYSLWAGIVLLAEILILLVWWKGGAWRQRWEAREGNTKHSSTANPNPTKL